MALLTRAGQRPTNGWADGGASAWLAGGDGCSSPLVVDLVAKVANDQADGGASAWSAGGDGCSSPLVASLRVYMVLLLLLAVKCGATGRIKTFGFGGCRLVV